MLKLQPIIGVEDVEKSSKWYQDLLGAKSLHGGDEFEMLGDSNDNVFLCLHKWGSHEHPTLSGSNAAGNGLILYFTVHNLDEIWANAQKLNAIVETEPHISQNSHQKEFSIRDLDNYFVTISL